jgi:hypothetical protein
VVFNSKVRLPTATLLRPLVLLINARKPTAVFAPSPLGVAIMALLPITTFGVITPPVLSDKFSRWAVTLPLNVAEVPPSAPLSVMPPNVGVLVVAMLWGRLNVTAPVDAETFTWLLVPVSEVTPVLLNVIDPEALLTPTPVPAVRLAKVNPLPLPINSCPFAAAEASTPVPPRAAAKVPLLMLLALKLVSALPSPEKLEAVTAPLNVAVVPVKAPVKVKLLNEVLPLMFKPVAYRVPFTPTSPVTCKILFNKMPLLAVPVAPITVLSVMRPNTTVLLVLTVASDPITVA